MITLPRIAVVGLFQSGKSTLINTLLGHHAAATGEGLRTSRLAASYRYGEAGFARGRRQDGEAFETSLAEFMAPEADGPWSAAAPSAEVFVHSPILRDVELVDTPGLDFSEEDNSLASAAAAEVDGLALVVTKQLALDNPSFCNFLRVHLAEKPYALLVNCGKDGPHLSEAQSVASSRIERAAICALEEMGLPRPAFAHRVNLAFLGEKAHSPAAFSTRPQAAGELAHLRDQFRLFGAGAAASQAARDCRRAAYESLLALRTASALIEWNQPLTE